jgi:hypothetical protein
VEAFQLRPTELVVSEVTARPVGTLGTTIEVALDGGSGEVTDPPLGNGLGNAVTVTEFVVVTIVLLV